MSRYVLVDETKRRGYVLVAAVVLSVDAAAARKTLRDLLLPGERRLHMKDERMQRKRQIASAIAAMGIEATVYDAATRYRNERERRSECLRAIVADIARSRGPAMLIIEQDESLVSSDRQQLIECSRAAGCSERLRYSHAQAASEPLLAIPDAVAWCWAKGGDWRQRIRPAITAVRQV